MFGFSLRWSLLVAAVALALSPSARAEDMRADSGPVSYHKDVLPILREHCQGCHQPAIAKGAYAMTRFDLLLKGGETEEAAIVPGNPEASTLLAMITPKEGAADMPKDKPPLSDAQVALIRRWIAEGAKDDSPAVAKKVVDAEHPPVYVLPSVVTSIDYSPDGKLLAISGYHEVVIHDVAKLADAADAAGSLVARLVGLSERIESIRFSPDGKKIAVSGGQPGRMGEVQVWDVETKNLDLSHPVTYDTVYGASWSRDGKLISFGCGDNTVRAIEAATGKQVLFNGAHSDWVLGTVFSTKSDHIISVSRDMSMKLIEVSTQRFIDNITSITPGALKGGLAAVDCHPTKDELLCAGSDGEPKLYKMVRTQARQIGDDFNLIRKYGSMPGRLCAARFSKDGSHLAAASSLNGSGEVRIFNTESGQLVGKNTDMGGGVFAVAFSPDGKSLAAGGFDGQIRILNAADGKATKTFVPVPLAPMAAAAPASAH